MRSWSDVLNRYEWNRAIDVFQLNDELSSQELDGMSEAEAYHASLRGEWNNVPPDRYREFVRMLIQGIVRRPDGEIDYESAGFRDANHWCTAHHQQIFDWADEVDRPGDMDWAWLERIYDFGPLFRSGGEFDAYFCRVLHVHDEDSDNYLLTQNRDLLTAVGLNPDTDRHRSLDFLWKFAIRMGSFFERNGEPEKSQGKNDDRLSVIPPHAG